MDEEIASVEQSNMEALPSLRMKLLNRRSFLLGSAAGLSGLGLSGCLTDGISLMEAAKLYGPMPNERFPIPAVDVSKMDPKYFRQTVRYDTEEKPGTIIIDPANYFVYTSKATELRRVMAQMLAAQDFFGAAKFMLDAKPNGRPGRRPRK
jgi:hypothetical protein